ncbi:TetR/AcrR family transcriptional regulator [Notoacmeibacter ruber]|uniref:TetR/AcrR family transcriptional regulator n=1 Tax=Notoacmeibacter ruber TaxID=2670375 RepID=A0A3L7JD01_9HYPH|nr:TetR/AcrR family transcriptional regulator [Notoacmeibacter ruber]RLQ88334.1 TetR/AcrR family transcriptional regulator [Notoacmeibacter ruber]
MPKVVDRDAMKLRVLDAAKAVLVREGLAEARMEQVARQAGIAKGTIYLYFDSKDALVAALLERMTKDIETALAPVDLPATLDEFLDEINRRLTGRDEDGRSVVNFFLIFGSALTSPPVAERLTRTFDQFGSRIAERLRALQDRGQVLSECDPDHAGRALAAMLDGLVLHQALFRRSAAEREKMVSAALAIIGRGLAADRR